MTRVPVGRKGQRYSTPSAPTYKWRENCILPRFLPLNNCAGNTRDAFTLIELLLVLAIVVAIMAVAMPAIHAPLENYRLRKAAELIQARWAKARNEAIRSGQTMVFRFQQNQNLFQIAPWITDADLVESSLLAGDANLQSLAFAPAAGTGMAVGGGTTITSALVKLEELPENVIFVGFDSAATPRDVAVASQMQAGSFSSDGWSAPILFYPDGTSSTVRLVLANSRGQFIMIKLRGLSGVGEISDLLTAEELALE